MTYVNKIIYLIIFNTIIHNAKYRKIKKKRFISKIYIRNLPLHRWDLLYVE